MHSHPYNTCRWIIAGCVAIALGMSLLFTLLLKVLAGPIIYALMFGTLITSMGLTAGSWLICDMFITYVWHDDHSLRLIEFLSHMGLTAGSWLICGMFITLVWHGHLWRVHYPCVTWSSQFVAHRVIGSYSSWLTWAWRQVRGSCVAWSWRMCDIIITHVYLVESVIPATCSSWLIKFVSHMGLTAGAWLMCDLIMTHVWHDQRFLQWLCGFYHFCNILFVTYKVRDSYITW